MIGITLFDPMNYYDENEVLVGFDTEFAEALCAELGVTPEFIVIDWDSKELELQSRKIDCIWNGLTITEERRENMDFSTAYLLNEQVVVVKADKLDQYGDLSALLTARASWPRPAARARRRSRPTCRTLRTRASWRRATRCSR